MAFFKEVFQARVFATDNSDREVDENGDVLIHLGRSKFQGFSVTKQPIQIRDRREYTRAWVRENNPRNKHFRKVINRPARIYVSFVDNILQVELTDYTSKQEPSLLLSIFHFSALEGIDKKVNNPLVFWEAESEIRELPVRKHFVVVTSKYRSILWKQAYVQIGAAAKFSFTREH